jgi:hypothetical protein
MNPNFENLFKYNDVFWKYTGNLQVKIYNHTVEEFLITEKNFIIGCVIDQDTIYGNQHCFDNINIDTNESKDVYFRYEFLINHQYDNFLKKHLLFIKVVLQDKYEEILSYDLEKQRRR